MAAWYLRQCPRCKGDLVVTPSLEPSVLGVRRDVWCLQCGWQATPRQVYALTHRNERKETENGVLLAE